MRAHSRTEGRGTLCPAMKSSSPPAPTNYPHGMRGTLHQYSAQHLGPHAQQIGGSAATAR